MTAGRVSVGGILWRRYAAARRRWWALTDPRHLEEVRGERVVFRRLERQGRLERFRGGRILEIGPKHGEDSRLLASLDPSELVLLDLPEKDALVHGWLADVDAHYVSGNLLYMRAEEIGALGVYDLVWCLGVVYHNVEQLRLLRRLFHLTRTNGMVVVESSTTRDRRLADRNVVEIHWPRTYRGERTITHHPSRLALKSWLEMVGFADVRIEDVFSRYASWQRAVVTGVRPAEPKPYLSYVGEDAPPWVAGDAT
jgi:SAM-dependent methyltransferase